MTYRIRLIMGGWFVLIFDATSKRIDDATGGPFDRIEQAETFAKETGYADADKG